ncbi:transketolase [Granulosicoccus antarcticus]|uniref:Transketolase n=1 Tax=Granulosicoccus antarcticus IMCC3135 TaxID=1192854 RepID=A0A2Z2NPK5_9GAMM|nr:transketolase [Granulosicoccus antarcticus]ASJ71598.1 Transketolase 1 [Granulosicoccus antarcticus IMCC3135]
MTTRRELANAVRALSMDAVQKANSGHPGAPMGMADLAEVVWNDFLRHNPGNPQWADRDRFVLSNGHASMLLYSLLHLTGYDLPIEELKNFRQLHSRTPGHPEYGYAPGVETTTGPLGQGIANAVGMALAERTLGAQFNTSEHTIVDHNTWVFLGDGCLMEGISHEACSLAGTLGLGKLIAVYDDNGISIDGQVEGWFTDNTPMRFEAYGWHVIQAVDGHDSDAIKAAVEAARAETGKPTLICARTTIGFGSPNKGGKESSHGAPLGDDEIKLAKAQLGWEHGAFEVPADVYAGWNARDAGETQESEWNKLFDAYAAANPELAAEFKRRTAGDLPENWEADSNAFIKSIVEKGETIASRKASQNALNGFGPLLPEFLGGSADLAGSNLTIWSGSKVVHDDPAGNYINYGVREFAMSAMSNGISLHGGFLPYTATFLMFSEYGRNALRMCALMKLPNIFVFTHDSIGLGEDGPTHQPVEQTATLRLLPNMAVWRPCDAVESSIAWKSAIERKDGPSCLIFSRQALTHQQRSDTQLADVSRGGYILHEPAQAPVAVIIATGSEVGMAMEAAQALADQGTPVRVVSMPSTDHFDAQDQSYRDSVLPPAMRARMAVEAGTTDLWRKYVGLDGDVMGIDTFGESGPAEEVFKHFGLTTDALVTRVQALVAAVNS